MTPSPPSLSLFLSDDSLRPRNTGRLLHPSCAGSVCYACIKAAVILVTRIILVDANEPENDHIFREGTRFHFVKNTAVRRFRPFTARRRVSC